MSTHREISPGIFFSNHSIAKFSTSGNQAGTSPTRVFTEKQNIDTDRINKKDIIRWGDGNDAPLRTLELIKKIGVAGKVVQVASAAHFGTGLSVFLRDENNEKKMIPFKKIPGLQKFDKVNNLNLFYSETINDLEIHEMCFTEFVLSKNFEEIVFIKRQQPVHCRFTAMNKKSARVEEVALSGDWLIATEENTAFVPTFSQYNYFEDIKNYCKEKKIYKFIIPFHYVRNGEVFYNQPFWHAPLKNGWADIILSVPEVKNIIANQQIQLKYIIHVSEEYFLKAYGINANGGYAWNDFSPEDQLKKQKELKTAIDEHLSGKEAAGRSITAPQFVGSDGKLVKSIEVEPIDDKLKDGAFLPDASAGNYEIAFAKGVDPAIIGAGIPGGKNLSGSGSDKREAYTILCANMVINRSISLLPFYFLRDWNAWGDDLEAGFPNVVLTTLDKNPSGKTKEIN